MDTTRRTVLKGLGGAITLPLLESLSLAAPTESKVPTRFLVVGNPFGAHPDNFFPEDFGKNFLGIHPSPPPADVIAEPDVRAAKTIKDILEAHRADKTCAACHQSIDPFGYAFENFDPMGAWRDEYTMHLKQPSTQGKRRKPAKEKGIPIDASASFLSGAGYKNITEFR